MEIELQVINPTTYDLSGRSKKILRLIKNHPLSSHITPEITQSMIEVNSSVHTSIEILYEEMLSIKNLLNECCKILDLRLSGGGTHPFQQWPSRKIYPTRRYLSVSDQYGYLAKMFTVFGIHIHLGCSDGDEAVYLIHRLSQYVPHFIALSAASPFYQTTDSLFDSSRIPTINVFPLSGFMPAKNNWQEITRYFEEMSKLEITSTFKDFYWDIRPRPDYGTIEVRVCDTPLTLDIAVSVGAYIYYLSQYLLANKAELDLEQLYLPYSYNRFQASRYGLSGKIVNPYNAQIHTINDQIKTTLKLIKNYVPSTAQDPFLDLISRMVKKKENNSTWLRKRYYEVGDLREIVRIQADLWDDNDTII
jgi:carboxylate-amine ligase